MRKSLGPKRFAAVMNEVASMATGVFQSISSQQELGNQERLDDERAIDVALGLKHARTDTVAGAGPLLPTEDYSPILQATFEPLERVSLSKYLDRNPPGIFTKDGEVSARASPIRSRRRRDAFDHALSRDAFGLRRAAMLDCVDRSLHAGMVLVWALVQQRSREKFHDLDAMAQLFLRAAIGGNSSEIPRVEKTRSKFERGRNFGGSPTKSDPTNRGIVEQNSLKPLAPELQLEYIEMGEISRAIWGAHEDDSDQQSPLGHACRAPANKPMGTPL